MDVYGECDESTFVSDLKTFPQLAPELLSSQDWDERTDNLKTQQPAATAAGGVEADKRAVDGWKPCAFCTRLR